MLKGINGGFGRNTRADDARSMRCNGRSSTMHCCNNPLYLMDRPWACITIRPVQIQFDQVSTIV
jgi:hypothetical protein